MLTICLVSLFSILLPTPASSVTKPRYRSRQNIHYFPVPPHVKKQVDFWESIFSRHPSTSVVIHDTTYPDLVIDLINYKLFAKKHGTKLLPSAKARQKITDKYLQRYDLALQRFAKLHRNAKNLGAIEARIYNVYRKNQRALRDLYRGEVKIRSQAGLSDEFQIAAKRSFRYLHFMEKTFQSTGVPIRLTRLAFVESMFNINAVSKVGASGIWQFMPRTARRFMRVSRYIDERNSPYKATRGAARLLRANFKELKSWPLAVTAYNHGAAGMARAARKLGTVNFDVIIKNYESKSFGFASKNFYAEFIAASNVYDSYFRPKRKPADSNKSVIAVRLKRRVSIAQLIRHTPLNRRIIADYNRCLLEKAYSRYNLKPLPKGFELFVPPSIANQVKIAIGRIKTNRYKRI